MRKREEGVGGQHQGMDRTGFLRDTKGGRRQAEVEMVARSSVEPQRHSVLSE